MAAGEIFFAVLDGLEHLMAGLRDWLEGGVPDEYWNKFQPLLDSTPAAV